MSHTTEALAALKAMEQIDPMSSSSLVDVQRLSAAANTHATLAQTEAIKTHTAIVAAFMATTVTSTQAKVLMGIFAGLNKTA